MATKLIQWHTPAPLNKTFNPPPRAKLLDQLDRTQLDRPIFDRDAHGSDPLLLYFRKKIFLTLPGLISRNDYMWEYTLQDAINDFRSVYPDQEISIPEDMTYLEIFVVTLTYGELEDTLNHVLKGDAGQKDRRLVSTMLVDSREPERPDCRGTPDEIWENRYLTNDYPTERAHIATQNVDRERFGPYFLSGRDPVHDFGLVHSRIPGNRVWVCCGLPESHPGCWYGETYNQLVPFDAFPGLRQDKGKTYWQLMLSGREDSAGVVFLTNMTTQPTAWKERKFYERLASKIEKEKDSISFDFQLYSKRLSVGEASLMPIYVLEGLRRIIELEREYNEVFCLKGGKSALPVTGAAWTEYLLEFVFFTSGLQKAIEDKFPFLNEVRAVLRKKEFSREELKNISNTVSSWGEEFEEIVAYIESLNETVMEDYSLTLSGWNNSKIMSIYKRLQKISKSDISTYGSSKFTTIYNKINSEVVKAKDLIEQDRGYLGNIYDILLATINDFVKVYELPLELEKVKESARIQLRPEDNDMYSDRSTIQRNVVREFFEPPDSQLATEFEKLTDQFFTHLNASPTERRNFLAEYFDSYLDNELEGAFRESLSFEVLVGQDTLDLAKLAQLKADDFLAGWLLSDDRKVFDKVEDYQTALKLEVDEFVDQLLLIVERNIYEDAEQRKAIAALIRKKISDFELNIPKDYEETLREIGRRAFKQAQSKCIENLFETFDTRFFNENCLGYLNAMLKSPSIWLVQDTSRVLAVAKQFGFLDENDNLKDWIFSSVKLDDSTVVVVPRPPTDELKTIYLKMWDIFTDEWIGIEHEEYDPGTLKFELRSEKAQSFVIDKDLRAVRRIGGRSLDFKGIVDVNYKWKDNSCWIDSVMLALFKIPGSWLENEIRKTTEVYVVGDCDAKKAQEYHRTFFEDLVFIQTPQSVKDRTCVIRSKWQNCFATPVPVKGIEDPGSIINDIFKFYRREEAYDLQFYSDIDQERNAINLTKIPEVLAIRTDPLARQTYDVPFYLNDRYKLTSVITHRDGGHYTTYVYDPLNFQWWYFDNKNFLKGLNPKEPLAPGKSYPKGVYMPVIRDVAADSSNPKEINKLEHRPAIWIYMKEDAYEETLLRRYETTGEIRWWYMAQDLKEDAYEERLLRQYETTGEIRWWYMAQDLKE